MATQRFEISWFLGFDVDRILNVVKLQPGVRNARKARALGWSNQPMVVRFSGNDEARGVVQQAIQAAGLSAFPAIIYIRTKK